MFNKLALDELIRRLLYFTLGTASYSASTFAHIQKKYNLTSDAKNFDMDHFCRSFCLCYETIPVESFYDLIRNRSTESVIWAFSTYTQGKCSSGPWKPYGIRITEHSIDLFSSTSSCEANHVNFTNFLEFYDYFEELYTSDEVWFESIYRLTTNQIASQQQIEVSLLNYRLIDGEIITKEDLAVLNSVNRHDFLLIK